MQIRQWLNRHPVVVSAVVGVCAIAAVAVALRDTEASKGLQKAAYFTTDDGKTWFTDDVTKVPPFSHDGRTAVRAYLYRCGEKDPPFVGYLERFNEQSKKKLEEAYANRDNKTESSQNIFALMAGAEIKKPGTGAWVSVTDPKSGQIKNVRCPDGGAAFEVKP